VQGVAQADVDVPAAVGRLVGGQAGDAEDEVVGERRRIGAVGPVDPADVAGDGVAEAAEQLGEGAVEVVAVAAPTVVGDAGRGGHRIGVPRLAGGDPERLVRHPLDVPLVEAAQGLGRRRLGVEAQAGEVGGTDIGSEGHGMRSLVRDRNHTAVSCARVTNVANV
jgi:hypothetical protein